jgi:hypothetical protein
MKRKYPLLMDCGRASKRTCGGLGLFFEGGIAPYNRFG